MLNEENPKIVSLKDSFFDKNFKKLIITGCLISGAFFIQNLDFSQKQQKFSVSSEKIIDNQKLENFKQNMINGKYNAKEISEIIKNNNKLISFASESVIPIIKKGYGLYSDSGDSLIFDYNNDGEDVKITKRDIQFYASNEDISPLKEKAIHKYLETMEEKYSKFLSNDFPDKIKKDIIESVIIYENTAKTNEKMFKDVENQEQRITATILQLAGITKEETGSKSFNYNSTLFSYTQAFGRTQVLGSMAAVHSMKMIIENNIKIDKIDISEFKYLNEDEIYNKLTNKLEIKSMEEGGTKWSSSFKEKQKQNIKSFIKRSSYALSEKSDSKIYLNLINGENEDFKSFSDKKLNSKEKREIMALKVFVYMMEDVKHQNLVSLYMLEDIVSGATKKLSSNKHSQLPILKIQTLAAKNYNGDRNINETTGKEVREHYASSCAKTIKKWGNYSNGQYVAMTTNISHEYMLASN